MMSVFIQKVSRQAALHAQFPGKLIRRKAALSEGGFQMACFI